MNNTLNIKDLQERSDTPNVDVNLDEKEKGKENYNVDNNATIGILEPFKEPIISFFDNFYCTEPARNVSLAIFLISDKHKKHVEEYRASEDEERREKIKKSLKCITPSGTFIQRRVTDLIEHSGLICIDIDSQDNGMIDLPASKHIIAKYYPSLYYAGLSLGGEGIFLIFRISNPECHTEHFEALAHDLESKFGLKVDRATKSVASTRVASYDPDYYYNKNPVPYENIMDTNRLSARLIRTATDKHKIEEHIERAVEIIQEKRIDITKQYEHWFKIGCALAYEFGEKGRHWFHMISRIYKNYNEGSCDYQYNRCLRCKSEKGTKIVTFFYYCKIHGVGYWKE